MAIVLNHLDNPMTILGVKLSSTGLIIGSFLFGALFESLLMSLGTLFLLGIIKKICNKLPPFTVNRWIYRSLPTRSPLFGKFTETLIESHKSKWCK